MIPAQQQRSFIPGYLFLGACIGGLAGFASAVSDEGAGVLFENHIITSVILGAITGATMGAFTGAAMDAFYRERDIAEQLGSISPEMVVKVLFIFAVVISSASLANLTSSSKRH